MPTLSLAARLHSDATRPLNWRWVFARHFLETPVDKRWKIHDPAAERAIRYLHLKNTEPGLNLDQEPITGR